MALNYLQRVAMSAVRTAAPVRPVAFGPPPMPGGWVGVGSRPAFPAPEAESPSPAVREGVRESPRHAAPPEVPAPLRPAEELRPMEEQPKPANSRDASEQKPAAVLDKLLGPAPQTVVRVPRTLRPIKPPAPIQPGVIGPEETKPHRPPTVTMQPAEIAVPSATSQLARSSTTSQLARSSTTSQLAVSSTTSQSTTSQPKTSPEPGGTEEVIVPYPAEAPSVIELHNARPQQVETNEPVQPLVTRQRGEAVPVPVQPASVQPTSVQPVPIPLERSEVSEMPRPRPDHIQPANHTEPLRLVFPRKRESRISIGRVEVQVNNQPAVPPSAPAAAPVSAGDSLSGRYLGRFALRP